MLGGVKEVRDLTEEETELVTGLVEDIEDKAGKSFEEFEPTQIRTQTVAGTNYFVKILVGDDSYVHARIHKPLSGEPSVAAVLTGKTASDPLEYFEA